jgi:hypothetical protein
MVDVGDGLSVTYETPSGLTVKRIQPVSGEEVAGPMLLPRDISQALLDHVIFMGGQPIDYRQHLALACIFGEPHVEGFLPDTPSLSLQDVRALEAAE